MCKDTELRDIQNIDRDILIILLDYCKYIYEEEKTRANLLNNTVKIYLAFLTFALGLGVWKMMPIDKAFLYINRSPHYLNHYYIFKCFFILSLFLFFLSFIFTILVLKVWKFERLCDPKERAINSVFTKNPNKILSIIISDYIVAANRNYEINEKKAKLLSKAVFSLLSGLILLLLTGLSVLC